MIWHELREDENDDQPASSFTIDGRASLADLVSQIAQASNAQAVSPVVCVYEDDEKR